MRPLSDVLAACALVSLSLVIAPSPARAAEAPDAEVKAVLDTEVAAMLKGDDAAFGATFRPDAVVWVSGELDPIASAAALKDAFHSAWVDRMDAPQVIKVGGLQVSKESESLALLSADLAMSGTYEGDKRYTLKWTERVTEVLVRAEDGSGPWLVQAALFSVPQTDKSVLTAAANGDGTETRAWTGGAPVDGKWIGDWFGTPGKWPVAAEASVFGTSPKERAVGKKAAGLVKSWKKLGFAIVGDVRGGEVFPCYWMMANVDVTMTVKKKPLVLHFRLMLVMMEWQESGEKEVLLAHFSPG